MRRRINIGLAVLAIFFYVHPVQAYTWYVNATNTPPGSGSLTDPYTAITSAVAALAATNAIEGTNGGHLILVATGTYTDQVTLTAAHAGAPNTANVFRAQGNVKIDTSGAYCFHINGGLGWITIDGFKLTGADSFAVWVGSGQTHTYRNVLTNCNIYSNGYGAGAYYRNRISLYNCTVYANANDGVNIQDTDGAAGYNAVVKNCIIAGNAKFGINVSKNGASYEDVDATYSCIYGNGQGGYCDPNGNVYHTESEINSYGNNSNNIVKLPGFADLANNWNFNSLYTNSPCLNSGQNGADMGAHQNPPQVSTSSATYYVAPTGDDNRTAADAQNPSTPWATISKAANYAVAGDTVRVSGGAYVEDVTITKGGAYGAPVTYVTNGAVIVKGTNCSFKLAKVGGVVLDGFTCTNASSAGVYLDCAAGNTVRGVTCLRNAYGIYFQLSSSNLIDSGNIYSNSASGVITYRSSSVMNNCRIWKNSPGIYSSGCYGGFYGCSIYRNTGSGIDVTGASDTEGPYLANCNIFANTGSGVNSYYQHSSVFLENCDIYSNAANGVVSMQGEMGLTNCIIANNLSYGVKETHSDGDARLRNCDLINNATNLYDNDTGMAYNTAAEINSVAGCSNNIVIDPIFKNVANDDLRLQRISPCIDAGTTNTTLTIDMYGERRLWGSAVDIGSYEVPPPKGTILRIVPR